MIRLVIVCVFVAYAVALPTTKHDVKEEVAGVASNADVKPTENEVENPRRTIITFDQRQEGKFNVRADLENFVIVFVPSSPSQGMSLLDMLASMKRNQGKTSNKKISSEKEVDGVKGKYSKKGEETPKVGVPSSARVVDHFIEGRTPYKVDISSTLTDTDTVEGNNNNRNVIVVESGKNRVPKHLGLYNNILKSNSVVALINPISTSRSRNSGDGYDVVHDALYQDKDFVAAPRIVTPTTSYLKELTDSIPSIDSLKLESPENDWKLLGATEPGCGPDKNMRRDSYGICRFYPIDV